MESKTYKGEKLMETYKGHTIVPQFHYFLVYAPGDWDCYQIPFQSVEEAKQAIDKGPEFLLSESHRRTSQRAGGADARKSPEFKKEE